MINTYIGLADCHGIESMQLKEDATSQDIVIRSMRASANKQRHAVYFEADLDEIAAKLITEALQQDYPSDALLLLMKMSEELRGLKGDEESWELIPNPKLDPYG